MFGNFLLCIVRDGGTYSLRFQARSHFEAKPCNLLFSSPGTYHDQVTNQVGQPQETHLTVDQQVRVHTGMHGCLYTATNNATGVQRHLAAGAAGAALQPEGLEDLLVAHQLQPKSEQTIVGRSAEASMM